MKICQQITLKEFLACAYSPATGRWKWIIHRALLCFHFPHMYEHNALFPSPSQGLSLFLGWAFHNHEVLWCECNFILKQNKGEDRTLEFRQPKNYDLHRLKDIKPDRDLKRWSGPASINLSAYTLPHPISQMRWLRPRNVHDLPKKQEDHTL